MFQLSVFSPFLYGPEQGITIVGVDIDWLNWSGAWQLALGWPNLHWLARPEQG